MKISKDASQRLPPPIALSQLSNIDKKQPIWPINHNKKHFRRFTKLLPIIPPKSFKALSEVEQILMKQIRDIDASLSKQNKHMKYQNGYLFSIGVYSRLVSQFHGCLKGRNDIVEEGFYVWKICEHENSYDLVTSRLIKSQKHFAEQLMEKSIANIQKYDTSRYDQSIVKVRKRWDNISQPKKGQTDMRRNRVKTEPQKQVSLIDNQQEETKIKGLFLTNSALSQNAYTHLAYQRNNSMGISTLQREKQTAAKSKAYSTAIQHLRTERIKKQLEDSKVKNESILSEYYARTKSYHQRVQPQDNESLATIQQLKRMLQKEASIVSIWMPPSNSPQFVGVLSVQLYEKDRSRVCWIKKYFWYRHGLNKKFFTCILQWASNEFGEIESLELTTTKNIYNSVFMILGWRISGWVSADKLKIIFSRNGR